MTANLRYMVTNDVDAVTEIDQLCSEWGWFKSDFLDHLRKKSVIGVVAEIEGQIVGFVMYELMNTRINLLNMAVRPDNRKMGIGTLLVDKLKTKLRPDRRTKVAVEIRERNVPAQLFFKNLGFKATEVMRKYYEDSGEDAFVMQFVLPPL